MIETTYKFLHLANYKDIPNWSVQYAGEGNFGFTTKFPWARIGSFLTKSRDIIEIQNNSEYRQTTIKINNGGVFPRNNGKTIKGSNIGTKRQYIVHTGQFIMSKIDARNGAYGIVPEELEGAVVTNDFPIFYVDTHKIKPQFLVLVSTTEKFIEFARKCSSGTTNRKRIDINAFLQQQIPLPSLDEQKNILEEYNRKLRDSKKMLDRIQSLKEEKHNYLKRECAFANKKTVSGGLLNFISYNEISRWDAPFYMIKNQIVSKYATKPIGALLEFFMCDRLSSLRMETKNTPNTFYHYIGMENVAKDEGCLVNLPMVKGSEIKSQTIRVPRNYIIYGKLRPYLNKYWVNNTDFEDIVCSSEFFCFKPIQTIDTDYFMYILSSYIIQDQISEVMSGARMPRIDEKIFKSLAIPVPNRNIQVKIARTLKLIDGEIAQLKENAKILRKEAINYFTKNLFEEN